MIKSIAAFQNKSQTQSHHFAIFKGLLWVALFVFLGRLVGAAKEMAIAYRFGVGEQIDAYLFMFNLVTWPTTVWLSVVSCILSPLEAEIRNDKPNGVINFRAELLAFSLLLGINLALLFWFGLPYLFEVSWLGLSTKTALIAKGIIPQIVSLIPLAILTNLLASWTLSSGRHSNTLMEGVPALCILISVLTVPYAGVASLIWGTVIGFVIHPIALIIPLIRRSEIGLPKFSNYSPYWSKFWSGFNILLIGSGLGSLVPIVDQFFAAQLDSGSIATVGYANRVLALLMGLGATAISRATLPVFSSIKAQDDRNLKKIAMFWVKIMFLLGLITMAVSWWLSPWIIKILFERGAFTAANTQMVSELFRYGLLQVPCYFAVLVIVTLLASCGKHKIMALGGISNIVVKGIANYYLVPILGVNGILLSSGAMYGVSMILLYGFASFGLKSYDEERVN